MQRRAAADQAKALERGVHLVAHIALGPDQRAEAVLGGVGGALQGARVAVADDEERTKLGVGERQLCWCGCSARRLGGDWCAFCGRHHFAV